MQILRALGRGLVRRTAERRARDACERLRVEGPFRRSRRVLQQENSRIPAGGSVPVPDAVLSTIHKYMLRGRDRDVGAEERRFAERLRRRLAAAPV